MGYVVRRCMYGGVGEKVKEKLLVAIARFIEILKTTARISMGVEFKGPVKVTILKKTGVPLYYERDGLDDQLFKELVDAKSFKIEFDVIPLSKFISKGYPSHVLFWYDEEKNLGNSINVDFITSYPEKVLSYTFFGLLAKINLPKLTGFRTIAEGLNGRIQELWESILRIAFGGVYNKTETRLQLRRYEPEDILINLFGKFVKIKEE